VNATLNHNVKPFLEELAADENLSAYTEKLVYNYQKGITHDGKPRPLKQDIFKRFKNWIKGK
jgi:hypothetical protein